MAEPPRNLWRRAARAALLPFTVWLPCLLLPWLVCAGAWLTSTRGVDLDHGLRTRCRARWSSIPADRWRPGDIVDDRVLVQLPVEMKPGDYQIYVGVSRHTTGARLAVFDGPGDGANRLRLEPLHVKTLVPMVHQLIPRTRVAEQRRHPERMPQ
jgi:hypothetical protein